MYRNYPRFRSPRQPSLALAPQNHRRAPSPTPGLAAGRRGLVRLQRATRSQKSTRRSCRQPRWTATRKTKSAGFAVPSQAVEILRFPRISLRCFKMLPLVVKPSTRCGPRVVESRWVGHPGTIIDIPFLCSLQCTSPQTASRPGPRLL